MFTYKVGQSKMTIQTQSSKVIHLVILE